MNNHRIIWFGRHEGWLRLLAHGVKDYDMESMHKAARLFDLMLPSDCIVCGMPGHLGVAKAMHDVAHLTKRNVVDLLECDPHESSYWQKRDGMTPAPFEMRIRVDAPKLAEGTKVYILDNVVCTGTTAGAAIRACERAGLDPYVVALTYSPWR